MGLGWQNSEFLAGDAGLHGSTAVLQAAVGAARSQSVCVQQGGAACTELSPGKSNQTALEILDSLTVGVIHTAVCT